MYKSERGITFMVLVITVLILLIIVSATTGAAISTYKKAKIKVFVEELDLIKEKMTLYEDKAAISSMPALIYIGRPIPNAETKFEDSDSEKDNLSKAKEILDKLDEQGKLDSVIKDNENGKYTYYRYMTHADLVAYFDIKDSLGDHTTVIIDTVTKKVYSMEPIKYEGRDCYSVDDIKGTK